MEIGCRSNLTVYLIRQREFAPRSFGCPGETVRCPRVGPICLERPSACPPPVVKVVREKPEPRDCFELRPFPHDAPLPGWSARPARPAASEQNLRDVTPAKMPLHFNYHPSRLDMPGQLIDVFM